MSASAQNDDIRQRFLSDEAEKLLSELSKAASSADAVTEGWADVDLISSFAPDTGLAATAPPDPVTSIVGMLPAFLIFVPLLITWLGLRQAAAAYQQMLADPATRGAARGQNFLELWQTGFAGKLTGVFRFDMVALCTLCAIFLLIVVTAVGGELRRREDRHRDVANGQLLIRLARSQLDLNKQRLANPGRFAAELSGAAGQLSSLLGQTDQALRRTGELAERHERTAAALITSTRALNQAVTVLRGAAADVLTAANTLQTSDEALRTDLTTRVAAAADRMDATAVSVARQAKDSATTAMQRIDGSVATVAKRLDDSAAIVVRRLDDSAAAAAKRLDDSITAAADGLSSQQESGRIGLEQLHAQLREALELVGARVEKATNGLVTAGEDFAAAIRSSGEDAAQHVGLTYSEAVATAARSMVLSVHESSTALSNAVLQVQRSADKYSEAAQAAVDGTADQVTALQGYSSEVTEATERSKQMLDRHATELGKTASRLISALDGLRLAQSAVAQSLAQSAADDESPEVICPDFPLADQTPTDPEQLDPQLVDSKEPE